MISIDRSVESVKVYIQGLLHLYLPRKFYFQSWVDERHFYVIEFYTETDRIKVEYDDRQVWEEILTALDGIL